ncbi:Dehydrocurvularin exporter [Lachnellula subtilissima]|uniref:Dehydrocurvularin exporter n=1 Tax=Lachnellula subtilissima TaxID=602034 RepID=A0A8H8RKT6_9HELO|nr:Dehydrocurvularin exporter [Lachnellula subtilissima]
MSAQSPDFDTSETTMAAAVVDGHTTDSTNNSEQINSNEILPDKQDGIAAEQVGDEPQYETGWRLAAVMITIFLTTLLAALDIGIVATAIPAITDEFRQLDDVGWYGGACFLLVGTSSPMWGKLYKYFPTKLVYLASVALFLIGSIVAATAPNSQALIVARALQGWGCSGSLGGSVLMISYVAEPKKRPMLIGLWMGVFMCSTIVGPLIGGAFTSEVTWRWCFLDQFAATKKEILLQLDLPGFTLLLTSLVCFTLALQWGGQSKKWSDGSVIATLVLWVVLTIAFVIAEWISGAYAMVPLSLLKPRMTWTNALYGYIGFLIMKTRLLQPYELTSGLLATAGAALLYTLDLDSSKARYIGPQVVFGFGLGLGSQIPMTALQAFSKPENVASTTGIMLMCNSVSGAYFVTAAQSIFANRLLQRLASTAPNIDAAIVLATGATDIQRIFSGGDLVAVLDAYMSGIKDVFAFSMAGAAATAVIALAIPFKKVPSNESRKTEEKVATAAQL